MLEALAAKLATNVLGTLAKVGWKNLTASEFTPYEKELQAIINTSVNEYAKAFPITENGKIPFYESITVLAELLKSRFTAQLNIEHLKAAIATDDRIIFPRDDQLQQFFIIFNSKLAASPKLVDLNIAFHYKEEVFRLSGKLDQLTDTVLITINDFKSEIRDLDISAKLGEEWSKQLDEILSYIRQFKAVTAMDRLEKLEQRMKEAGVANDKQLFSRLYYLQAVSLGQMEGSNDDNRMPELVIKSYVLNPYNAFYKSHAAISYYALEDRVNATRLAAEILEADPFNPHAWAAQCFLAEVNFRKVLQQVPAIVKKKEEFIIQLYLWLNAKRFINSIRDFHALGLAFAIDVYNEPGEVTQANRYNAVTISSYLLSEFYESRSQFSTMLEFRDAATDKRYVYAARLLERLEDKLKGTEIEQFHRPFFFQFYIAKLVLTGDTKYVHAMEREFQLLGDKSHDIIVRMAQAWNNLNTIAATRKSLDLLETWSGEGTEIITLFSFLNASILQDEAKAEFYAIKYLETEKEITEYAFLNMVAALRSNRLKLTTAIKNKLLELVGNAGTVIKRLLKIVIYIMAKEGFPSDEECYKQLLSLEKEMNGVREEISIHLPYSYGILEKYEDGIRFLKPRTSMDRPSESLKVYCKLLFKTQGHKPELLQLLKKWRTQFNAPDKELLDMEAYFGRLAKNWKEVIVIAKYALNAFPGDDNFLYLLFISWSENQELRAIKDSAHLLDGITFRDEIHGIAIAQVLIKAGLHRQALDILYKQASDKNKTRSREALFMMSMQLPPELMQELPEVVAGCTVTYEAAGKEYSIEITEENLKQIPQSLLLGKKTGEQFSFYSRHDTLVQQGKILRVSDKYLALFDEIRKEAENPMSGMDIMPFQFEGDTVEEMNKTFIKNFGAIGSMQKEQAEKLLKDYHNGIISFSEITAHYYRDEAMDAYYSLSHPWGRFFKAISPAVSPNVNFNEQSKMLLDITAVCLLYELEKELGLTYPRKFIISGLLRPLLVQKVSKLQHEPRTEMSLSITQDSVRPIFYTEDYYEKRKEHLENILHWVDANCEAVEVPERFNFIMGMEERFKNNGYFQLVLENKLLSERDDTVLFTDDIIYYRTFRCSVNEVAGTQVYLYHFHKEKRKEIISYLLEHNYIGVPLTAELLNEELFKFLSGKENRYTICLENLRYAWNPDKQLLAEAIQFIKTLYTGSVITTRTRQQAVAAVFTNLMVGMPLQMAKAIPGIIINEFRLLGMHQVEVMAILTAVVKSRGK